MRTILITAYNDAMAPIGDLTSPLMQEYALRHGFEFFCSRVIPDGLHYWQKIGLTLGFLGSGMADRVIWLDADIVITNMDWTPPWFTGFQASLDWGTDAVDESCLSMCAYIVGMDMIQLFRDISDSYEKFKDVDFPEQSAARHCYREGGDYKFRMRTHPRRTFNAVPSQIGGAVDAWQKGDWLCHLTHVEFPRRVELFHEIRKEMVT